MSGRIILITLALVASLLAACDRLDGNDDSFKIKSSGKTVTREEAFTGFDRVDASNTFDVSITQGDTFSVVLHFDENVQEYLDVRLEDGTLLLGLDLENSYSVEGDVTLEAAITMPQLRGVNLSGASRATISEFETEEDFTARISGASRLEGDVVAGAVWLDISGASRVELRGGAEDLTVDASGASQANLANFPATDAHIDASGSSRATVLVSGTLDADASGASQVTYAGDPALGVIDTSGSSTIKQQ